MTTTATNIDSTQSPATPVPGSESSGVADRIQPLNDAAPAEGETPGGADASQRLVPVGEAIRYRKRAQSAEQQLTETRERLDALEHQLAEAGRTIEHLERRQQVDALLAEADAVDPGVAALLTEAALAEMDEPDVHAAVEEVRRTKPYLFRRAPRPGAQAMPARHDDADDPVLETAADRAAQSGHRQDLLSYLRLRRGRG